MNPNQQPLIPFLQGSPRVVAGICLLLLSGTLHTPALPPGDGSNELFTGANVRQIQIELTQEGMETLEEYHQVWGQKRPERRDVKATVREGGSVYTNVAIHLKGSYTFQPINRKPSLTLNFDKFAPGQRFHGLDKIHLNNSVQDATFLCEKLARELFNAAGVPASRIGHAVVELNGRKLGFYVLVEGYNKRFLKRHFSSAKGNLYDGGSGGDISKALEVDSGENPDDRSDLARLLAATREKDASVRLRSVEAALDVDRFLTFAALEVLLQHWDGYCLSRNNFRLFKDAEQDRLVFMPHGLDQILGMRKPPQPGITPQWGGVVARAVMGTPQGRRRYLRRMEEVVNLHCKEDLLLARIDRWAAAIRPFAAPGFIDRFRFQSAIDKLKSRLSERIREVRGLLETQERPMSIAVGSSIRLDRWTFRSSAAGLVEGRRADEEGRAILAIEGGGQWASGSWRRQLLLEAGRYELTASAKVQGLAVGATNSGALLRISGDRETPNPLMNSGWSPLRYAFDVPGAVEVELVCEFRGASGSAHFDAGTIQLKRLPEAP